MPRNYFSEQEMKLLSNLDVVSQITSSTITYTFEFKVEISNCKSLTDARQLMNDNPVTLDIIRDRIFENAYFDFVIKNVKKLSERDDELSF